MRVTGIRFDYVHPSRLGLCARASVTFDKCFVVHNMCVVRGKKGLCVTYPNNGAVEDGVGGRRYIDVAHPIDNSFSKEVASQVLKEYESIVAKIQEKTEE